MKYSVVLNTHIPVSDLPWAYEALFHTYLPLFRNILNYPVTMGFSPQLILEFTHPDFKNKCKSYYQYLMKQTGEITHPSLKKYYQDYYTEHFHELENADFDTRKLWQNNAWEILAYPSTHCVMPLVTEKVVRLFLEQGENLIRDYFNVNEFKGVWLPEMAFEDGANNLKSVLAERYDYIFGNWKTVQGFGHFNRLYHDPSGLKLVIRNDQSQSMLWGDNCRFTSFKDFRETHRSDRSGNKLYAIHGNFYRPEDTREWIDRAVDQSVQSLNEEIGDYTALMFDTEYFGHHFWEGKYYLPELLSRIKDDLIHAADVITRFESREIDLSGACYTWGSTGDDRGNSNLDTWVNSRVHRMLQLYREVLIRISGWDQDKLTAHLTELNTFFSSDWLFIIYGNHQDIYNGNYNTSEYSRDRIFSLYEKIINL